MSELDFSFFKVADTPDAFDIEKFLSTRLHVLPGEMYQNYVITEEELKQQPA